MGEGPPPLDGNCNFALCSRYTHPYCAHKSDDPLLLLSLQTARQDRVGKTNPDRGRWVGGKKSGDNFTEKRDRREMPQFGKNMGQRTPIFLSTGRAHWSFSCLQMQGAGMIPMQSMMNPYKWTMW